MKKLKTRIPNEAVNASPKRGRYEEEIRRKEELFRAIELNNTEKIKKLARASDLRNTCGTATSKRQDVRYSGTYTVDYKVYFKWKNGEFVILSVLGKQIKKVTLETIATIYSLDCARYLSAINFKEISVESKDVSAYKMANWNHKKNEEYLDYEDPEFVDSDIVDVNEKTSKEKSHFEMEFLKKDLLIKNKKIEELSNKLRVLENSNKSKGDLLRENKVLQAHKRDLEEKIKDIECFFQAELGEAVNKKVSTWEVKYNSVSKDLIRLNQEIKSKNEAIKKLEDTVMSLRKEIRKTEKGSSTNSSKAESDIQVEIEKNSTNADKVQSADASHGYHNERRENGKFGSLSSHDNYGDEYNEKFDDEEFDIY